jgi:hypothetical protein
MKNRGPWSRVSSIHGGIHLLDPSHDEIWIDDIAHSLALQCRYNGNIQHCYSVAEHSVKLSYMVDHHNLEALMHDAAETYLGDVSRPFQDAMGPEFKARYKEIEAAILKVIGQKYAFTTPIPLEVMAMDTRLMRDEMAEMDADEFDDIEFWSADHAEHRFLDRFYELRG